MNAAEKTTRDILCLDIPGGEKNFSINAGAGAGKSTLLAKRISKQIKGGENLESFAIITYTNEAANELRDKIANELSEMLSSAVLTLTEKQNITNALEKIELIQISTIHSFLFQILRKYAFESHLALDAKMLEDADEKEGKKRFFDKWIGKHFSDLYKFKTDWTIKSVRTGRDNDYTRDVLWNAFLDIASLRENIVFDTSDHTADFEKMAKEYVENNFSLFEALKNEVMNNRPQKKDGTYKKLINDVESFIDNVNAVKLNYNAGHYGIEDACNLSNAYGLIIDRLNAKKKDPDMGFYGKNTADAVLEPFYPIIPENELDWNFDKYYNDYMLWSQKAAKVMEYAVGIKDEYQKETDADTKNLSNDDILYRAEKLLMEHSEILDILREKYSKIYVDEFQDTTACQARIIKLLSGKIGSKLTPFDPKDNCLVIVGDPKQSIYRFTGAEKIIYEKMHNEIGCLPTTLGRAEMLCANFRSNEKIVDWVNRKYSKLMGTSYTTMESEWPINEKNALYGVFKYGDSTIGIDEYNEKKDAESVTKLIKQLVENAKCFIEERNPDDNSYSLRRIRYSDFMVLTWYTTDMEEYITQFNKDNIPLDIQGKFKFEDNETVRNFIRVLNYFSDSKNKNIRYAASQISGRTSISKDEDSGLAAGMKLLKNLKDDFSNSKLNTAAIAHRIIKEENLYLPDGTFDIPRIKEYKTRLNQMVETCLTNNEGDIAEFVSTLLLYITEDVGHSILLETGEDTVQFMNIHKAKGLTGKIVIVANRCKEKTARYNGFKNNGEYYPAASYKTSKASSSTIRPAFAYDDSKMKQAGKEEREENIRLEYVAATRAAHALIFMPSFGRNKEKVCFANPEYSIENLQDINDWIDSRTSDTNAYSLTSNGAITKKSLNLKNLEDNLSKANLGVVNSAVIDIITPSSLEMPGITGYSPTDSGYVKETARPHGNIFGDVMHRTYEIIFNRFYEIEKLSITARDAVIKQIVNQAISEQFSNLGKSDDPLLFASYLESKMKDYYDRIIVPIMQSALEVYPEYSFSFFVPQNEVSNFVKDFDNFLPTSGKIKTDNIWVNGQADLVIKQKDGTIKVYDYKSDAMSGKPLPQFETSLAQKYEGQLKLYEYAIGKSFSVNKVQTEIIHLYR